MNSSSATSGSLRATREDQTRPVQTLRESATAVGLLRKQHGRLLLTATGRRLQDDPRGLFNRIRDRLALGRGDSIQDAGLLALLYAAAGEDFYTAGEAAAEAFASLGWASSGSLEWAVWYEAGPTWEVVKHFTGRYGSTAERTRIARALLTR